MVKPGVTYFGPDWMHTGGATMWRRDFADLNARGIDTIMLINTHAQLFDSNNNLRPVTKTVHDLIDVAGEYGINCHTNIHTNYKGSSMGAGIPNLRDAIYNSIHRKTWLDGVRK